MAKRKRGLLKKIIAAGTSDENIARPLVRKKIFLATMAIIPLYLPAFDYIL